MNEERLLMYDNRGNYIYSPLTEEEMRARIVGSLLRVSSIDRLGIYNSWHVRRNQYAELKSSEEKDKQFLSC